MNNFHNGVCNGLGFVFPDEGGMTLEKGGTTLHSLCPVPKGLEDIPTKYTFDGLLSMEDRIRLLAAPVYRGTVKLQQFAYLKDTYKGKNENGGRSCKMVTPGSYKNRSAGPCIPWGTMVQPAVHWVPEVPREHVLPRSVDMENIT